MTDTTTTEPYVRCAVDAGFGTITLDSPHNRNAISPKLVRELSAALADAAADDAVRGIVLTHAGNTFCAGADLSAASDADPEVAADERTRAMIDLLRGIVEHPKPIIALIDGHVRAGGMGIVAACDLVVAGPASTFALTEVRIGVAPFMISLTLLPRLDSRAASRYYLTGEKFDAATAVEIGLVTIASEAPAEAVGELRSALGKASPVGLAEAKKLVNASMLAGFDSDADELARRSAEFFGTDEAIEGMTAFLQKRPPRWAI